MARPLGGLSVAEPGPTPRIVCGSMPVAFGAPGHRHYRTLLPATQTEREQVVTGSAEGRPRARVRGTAA